MTPPATSRPLTAAVSATTPTPPDTIIDSGPPAGDDQYECQLHLPLEPRWAGRSPASWTPASPAACTSPKAYTGLAQGVHTFSVFATVNGVADPTPATATWTVDTTAPSAPTGLTASFVSPTSVQLTWIAATDNTGVTGYNVLRDGAALATIGAVTTYTDATVVAGTTPAYTLRAFDIAGNLSPSSASVSPPPMPYWPRL